MRRWDEQFSGPEYRYGTEPNAFVREQAFRLKSGSAVLVPGDGEGRNSVWLAEQGHEVTAVDGSAVGIRKAQELASSRGVRLTSVHADLEAWAPAPGSFDAVVLTYVHLPAAWRAATHRRLFEGLRPGGWLILEAFNPRQLGRASGGPKDVTMLFTLEMIRGDVAGIPPPPIEEVLAWEGEAELDEGPLHRGLAQLTRYIGQRRHG